MILRQRVFSLCLCLLLFSLMGCLRSSNEAPSAIAKKYEGQVILYSTSWCGYCRKTRQLFNEHNIPFTELDIETSSQANSEFGELGGKGVPVVLAKGRTVHGYAPQAFLKLIRGSEQQ